MIWVVAILLVLGDARTSRSGRSSRAPGVAGVALGFGAQAIVRDTLAGFFILLENQFGVSDVLDAADDGRTGRRQGRGALVPRDDAPRVRRRAPHACPNGNIQVVSNKSRGWARAIVDVRVAYGEDVERVREVLDELFDEVRMDTTLRDWIREGPSVLGIETLSDYAQVVRVVADTRPSKRFDVERALRERVARKLAAEGIQVPMPPTITPGAPPP